MSNPAVIGSIDVAQLVLYGFWIFFACLIFYLHRENKREGYPLESDRANARVKIQGFPAMPDPKTYKLANGGTVQTPRASDPQPELRAQPVAGFPGAPLAPTGDPMLDGVGPAAYALRAEQPDRTLEGAVRIVPLRVATDHSLEARDPEPRGMPVIGADGATGGIVRDVWVDRSEAVVRYLEVEATGGRRVLLPLNLARVGDRSVRVKSVYGKHFATAPVLQSPEQVTLREEDRICAYFASGHLYASPERQEPLL